MRWLREARPGDRISFVPFPVYQYKLVRPPMEQCTVLAAWEGGLICTGLTPQSQMVSGIQECCREAGVDPTQRVQYVLLTQVREVW